MEISHQVIDVPPESSSKAYDDDGHVKRTGTLWTATSHIITAVIGSGVLSLAWAIAQLGWVAGPIMMLLFAFVINYTSCLLAECYRTGDPDTGKRNYTYMDAVRSNLGGMQVKICGFVQYLNLFGVAIGYTIAASISAVAINRSNCFHEKGDDNPCTVSSYPYMLAFGVCEIIFSQLPDFHQLWWLSIVAAAMSFLYSFIGLGLGIGKTIGNGTVKGSLTGVRVGEITEAQKIWRSLQALGDIAFSYSFSLILIEIQDTVKSPPSEAKTMKKATTMSILMTTTFYMLCGCMGYSAFGDGAPGNLLTGFGFYNPFWLIDIANAAIVIHLVGAYQVFCQPLFYFVETTAAEYFPNSKFITRNIPMPLPGYSSFNINFFRLVWRTVFVILTTVMAMLLPFFNDVVGLLGALAFFPLTVYFPIEMYIAQKNIPKWSPQWTSMKILSLCCAVISLAGAAGSLVGIVSDFKRYTPFGPTN